MIENPPADLTTAERAIFSDMYDHEVVYREVLHYYLDPTGKNVLFPTDFVFNTKLLTLNTRAGVLAAAQQLEDLATAAYPTLLPLFASTSGAQRVLLLKSASVQGRHAATVRDLVSPGSFADATAVDTAGQIRTKTPTEVTAALAPYFAPYVISVANLALPA